MGMMYFQVEEDKIEKVSEHLEKGLSYIGKAMQCLDEMKRGGNMGERDDYNYRGSDIGERRWGNQYGRGYTRGSYGDRMTPPYYDPIYG